MKKNKTVLVVEDEIALREAYKLILNAAGFDVFTAPNGQEGLKQLKLITPAVVLLDVFMPVLDGKEFLKNIDIQDYPDTKFIAFSNLNDQAVQSEMLKLGANCYVLKSSLNPRELVQLIQKTLRKKN